MTFDSTVLPPCRILAGFSLLSAWVAWSRYLERVATRPQKWGYDQVDGAVIAFADGLRGAFSLIGVTTWAQARSDESCLSPEQRLYVAHPHGCFTLAIYLNFVDESRRLEFFTGMASVLFKVPVIREFMLIANGRPAIQRMLDTLMKSGKSVVLMPGGISEQLATDHSRERAFFPPKLGFVRLAIKHGVPMVPVYSFGENQLYRIPEWSRRASTWLRAATGAGIPFPIGRFGLPFVPKATHIKIYVGKAVQVGPADSDPSEAHVHAVFGAYCVELRRLFNEHKDDALPADVAARGLELIWRGRSIDAQPPDEHISTSKL